MANSNCQFQSAKLVSKARVIKEAKDSISYKANRDRVFKTREMNTDSANHSEAKPSSRHVEVAKDIRLAPIYQQ